MTRIRVFLTERIKRNQSEISFLLPVVVMCAFLVGLWFRGGLFLGYAENEATWYRPNVAFLYVWVENIAAGKDLLFGPPGIFDSSINFFLFSNHVPPLARQAALFFTILVTGGMSIFFLTRDSLANTIPRKEGNLSAMLAAFFYILNPYSMTAVWKRFIYANFFAFALFPLSLLLFERSIKTRKMTKYAILASLATVAFSFAFTITGFLVVYWILISGWAAFRFLLGKRSERWYAVKSLALLLPIWVSFNAWWMAPSIFGRLDQIQTVLSGRAGLGGFGPGTYFSRGGNLATATAQSLAGGGVEYVMRLVYGVTSGYAPFKLWGSLYENPFLTLLTFVPLSCVALSLLSKPRNRTFLAFGLLTIFGIFWANGVHDPSGALFVFLFKNIDLLNPLRAPFELGAIILSVSMSFFFGIGVRQMLALKSRFPSRHATKLLSRGFVFLILVGTFLIYPLPMWSGATFVDVFSPPQNPLADWKYAHIDVPSYYAQANTWLDSDTSEFRILHLPLSYTGGAEYNWPHPFQGGDPSDTLFDKPSIALSAAYGGPIDSIMSNLVDFMGTSPNLWKVLSLLNVKYIVLHKDANTTAIRSPPVDQMQQFLSEVQVPSALSFPRLESQSLVRQGWTTAWGNNTMIFSSPNNSSTTLIMQGIPDENGLLGSRLTFQNPTNWGTPMRIHLSFATNATGNLVVQAWDAKGNGIAWYRTLNETSQLTPQMIDLPAQTPDDLFVKPAESFMFGNVSSVLIGLTHQLTNKLTITFKDLSVSFYSPPRDGTFLSSGKWNGVWANSFALSQVTDSLGPTVSVSGVPGPAGFGLYYRVGPDFDWSRQNFLSFQLESDMTGPLLVQVWDRFGNAFFWDGRANPDFRIRETAAWQNITLDLNLPMQVPYQNRLDFRSIDHLLIAWVGQGNAPAALSVRGLSISQGSTESVIGIDLKTTFGQLVIYKLGEGYFAPPILVRSSFTTVDDYIGLFNLLRGPYDPRNSLALITTQMDPALNGLLKALKPGSQPNIDTQKIDPTSYVVHIKNATSPFIVVLDAEFNSNWLASADGQEISQVRHFVANGYANAWYIEKSGSYDITFRYAGQRLFWYGTAFSLASLATSIGYLTIRGRLRKAKYHESDFGRSLANQ